MRLYLRAVIAILLSSSIAAAAEAQNDGDAAAYFAIVFTPVGALPPQLTPAMAGEPQTRTRFRAQYGRLSFSSAVAFNNVGVGLDFGRRRGSLGLTLGYGFEDCDAGCESVIMIGGHLEGMLASSSLGGADSDSRLTMGLRGDVGFGRADDLTALSAVLGVPLTIVIPSEGLRFAPFLTPGLGVGRLSDDDDADSGVRFTLGGGIGVLSASRIALFLGFQKVFIDGGDTQVGIGVTWNVGR